MMAVAASNAATPAKPSKIACKPRANYLKPKEISETARMAAPGVLTCGMP
jgi:hypothetical protein